MIRKTLCMACIILGSMSCAEQFNGEDEISWNQRGEAVFTLYSADYEQQGAARSRETATRAVYDFLDYCIVDETGKVMSEIRLKFKPETSEIVAEGLHEGSYRLLVLGVKGDKEKDRATINKVSSVDDVWLSFPEDLAKPLECEYFYSDTPFRVMVASTEGGKQEVVSTEESAIQHRIVGKLNFDFEYENTYIESAVTENVAAIETPQFYTTMTAGQSFSGQSDGSMEGLNLCKGNEYLFMPTVDGHELKGEISMMSRVYTGGKVAQSYGFGGIQVLPNQVMAISTKVNHPENQSGTMFVTSLAYQRGNHKKILQDDEHKSVYTDKSQRSFNTSHPLQLSVTDEGQFHLRFYSPRDLGHVTIKALIPAAGREWIDFAYLDTIPAFGDAFLEIQMLKKETVCRGENGQFVHVPKLSVEQLQEAQFKIESPEEYWKRIQGIKHGWTLYWGLFGGDPEKPDGGPTGNWMGIRPVHIRESIAFFLNFTYLIDMDDHERILNENLDKLYDDNKQPVTAERVLAQMRQERTLQVGLVWPGNNVAGLGSPGVFGARQQAWFNNYNDRLECSIMFHELGHVMGYGHSSSFTYGPWAESLMNNFYINNLHRMPIDSKSYLNSENNPHKY